MEVLFKMPARPTGWEVTNKVWTRRWDSLIKEVTLAMCLQSEYLSQQGLEGR